MEINVVRLSVVIVYIIIFIAVYLSTKGIEKELKIEGPIRVLSCALGTFIVIFILVIFVGIVLTVLQIFPWIFNSDIILLEEYGKIISNILGKL